MTVTAPAPDTVSIAIAALQPLGYQVHNQVPSSRPPQFLRVIQVGGHRANLVQHARTIAVEAWAPSPAVAHQMSEAALARISALEGQVVNGVGVYRVDVFTAPADWPDDETRSPRFRFTAQLFTRTLPTTS